MRRILHFAFLASVCAFASAQSAPPQFQNLLTTSTDYTCAGVVPCATWPMPAMPSVGGSYADPTWGTTTYRLAVPPANVSGQAITTYSRVQAWSADNKHMFLTEPTSGIGVLDLYDATTTPPTPINRITTTDGSLINSIDGDAYWSNTIPTRIYYVPWGLEALAHGDTLQLRYVDVSNCTAANCVLTPTIVHTFSCKSDAFAPFGAGVAGNVIETGSGGEGGMFDSTDNYFSFTCDALTGNGRGEIDFIRYEQSTNTVTTQEKWYTVCPGSVPTGCQVWSEFHGYNMIRMNQHPNANYISVIWQCGDSNATWQRGCGTETYGPSYNFLGPSSASIAHQDNGFDINGVPVTVFIGANTGTIEDAWSLEISDLTKLSPTGITSKVIYLPCQYARVYTGSYPCIGTSLAAKTNGSHISMTGSWGSFPGYGLMSTMTLAGAYGSYSVDEPLATTLGTAVTPGVNTVTPASMQTIAAGVRSVVDFGSGNQETVTWTAVNGGTATATFAKAHPATAKVSNLSAGDTGTFAMENLAVLIDTTAPNASPATFYRLGRAMSIRDADYNAEPHATVNRDFTQFTWGSNWNTDGGRAYGFWTGLNANGVKSPANPVALSVTPDPAVLDEEVTLTGVVSQTAKAVPTGTINFLNGAESLGSAPLDSSGTASLGLSTLAAGSYSVVASYSGDSNYPAGSSSAVSLDVQSTTTTSLAATPNPVTAGQALTLTATVTGNGDAAAAGTVDFFNGAALLGSSALNASGVATLSTAALAAGNYNLTAQYVGDASSLTSTSPAVSVKVTGGAAQPTTTTLSVSPNPAVAGQALALTATVTETSGAIPAGTINFLNGATLLGTGTLNAAGVVSVSTSALAAGTYSLTAQYVGSATSLTSTSPAVSVTVNGAVQPTTTTLVANPNPVSAKQTLSLTATATASGNKTPTGLLNFLIDNTVVQVVTVNSSGVGTLSIPAPAAGTHTLWARYRGDGTSAASTSPAVTLTVMAAGSESTTTTLAATPNPVAAGNALTLTATVKSSGATTPTGTVNFLNGAALVGTGTLNASGVATLSTASLGAGSYNLTAQYVGNASSAASTSSAVSVTVTAADPQSTTTTLVVTPNPATVGQALVLTATVTGSKGKTPTGLLNFLIDNTVVQVVTVNSSGVGTLSIPAPAAGTHTLWARYRGEGSSAASTSVSVKLTVNAEAQSTTTSLVAAPNPVAAGQALVLTATVKGSGSTTPAGPVKFLNGAALLGTGTLNASGVASLSTSSLAAGAYSLKAQYVGNASSLTSTSPVVPVTVTAAGKAVSTTTKLAASADSVTVGQAVLLTATVQATGSAIPAGSVTFLNGATALGTANLNASGVATLSTEMASVGKFGLSAEYEGNKNFLTSSSPAVSVEVTAQVTTTSLVASAPDVTASQPLILTATVKGAGAIVPGGTIGFMEGATKLGAATLNAAGVATLSISTLAPGTYALTADYAGNASSLASKSAGVTVTVTAKAASTTTSLAASPSAINVGQAVKLTATVQATGAAIPAGAVTFLNGKTALGTANLGASGVATLSVTSLAVGKSGLSAEYEGNKSFLTSTSPAVSVTVTAQGTTTSLAVSASDVIAGQAVALTATVKGSGTVMPAGTVNFMNGAALLGTSALNAAGVATLSTSTLAPGSYSLTADYAGNVSSLASKSAGVAVTVAPKVQPTTTSLALSADTVNVGQALALTATVGAAGPGLPAGTVSFLNGATVLGSANLKASGVATFSISTLVAGTYSLTAEYAGDASFLASTSAGVDVTVNAPASSGPGAPPPAIFYTDITSGPNTGGEGNNGSYLTIFGSRFGAAQGTSKVTIDGKAVAQYLFWSDTKIGVQVGPVTSGAIVVNVGGVKSNANLTFTVRSGNIYFIGSSVDNSAPPADCSTLLAGNSYEHPWGLTNYASRTESDYSYTTMRTPYTYYHCISQGDTLVFLNGVSYPYFDGRGMHASLTLDKMGDSATSFVTFMARPGAAVELGGTGWAMAPISDRTAGDNAFSGLTLTGSGANGGAYFNAGSSTRNERVVGNEITCPDCTGPGAAVMGGNGFIFYGNKVDDISTLDRGGSNKGYDAIAVTGNNTEIAWNKVSNTLANNGIEVNAQHVAGFFNQSYHDNDISQVNGDGIDLSTIDPSSGYIKVYNNVIHQVGGRSAADGSSSDPHACIGVKGLGTAAGVGTAEIYNNTMYDCSAYLDVNPASNASCAILVAHGQLNVTTSLVNNIAYQPTYAGTQLQSVYICGGGSLGTISGSNNLWYSDSAPGSTAPATSMGTIANPRFISDIDYRLLLTSPAIGAGVAVESLATDFDGIARPKPPSIGAFE